jgi:hypothetical protein
MNADVPPKDEHEEINLDNAGDLTIKDGELYWKKNRLKTETVQHFALTAWQGFIALAVAIAAVVTPVITYLAELENICKSTGDRAPLCPFKAPDTTEAPGKTAEPSHASSLQSAPSR